MRAGRADLLPFPFMNTLIENAESLEYLTTANQWSKKAADGKCFGNTGTAFDAAKKELIGKFNIVGYICQTGQLINLNHGRAKVLLNPSRHKPNFSLKLHCSGAL